MTQGINSSLRCTMHEDAPEVAGAKERAGLVAIMVPSRNAGPFLAICLSSLTSQTYKNIKIIIVDDCSTDGSFDVARSFKNECIHVFRNLENQGVARARNQCLDIAMGFRPDYLMFVDADDYVESDYVEKMLAFLVNNNADIVSGSFFEVKGDTKWRYHAQKDIPPRLLSGAEATKLLLEDRTIISHLHGKVFKAHLWDDIRLPPSIRHCEDRAVCFRVFLKARAVFNTNYAGYYYREDNPNALCAEKWLNNKILSTYEAYLAPVIYDYSDLPDALAKTFQDAASYALFRIHLSLYPRFDYHNASSDELDKMKHIFRYIKKHRLGFKFKPQESKERIKCICYNFSKKIYRLVFRIRLTRLEQQAK